MELSSEVKNGQAIYSKSVLSLYDFLVLGVSNRFIWCCPTSNLLENFNKNISSNHLDIGVGTGYFLAKCQFPSNDVRIALMDLNQNSLDESAKRIERFGPVKYRYNVLEAVDLKTESFDSVSVNYLFHCLPGTLLEKMRVLDNIHHLLNDNAKIFGSTILSKGIKKNSLARKLMSIYNKKGVFSNSEDSLEDLEKFLSNQYSHYKITVIGCVAIFSATK